MPWVNGRFYSSYAAAREDMYERAVSQWQQGDFGSYLRRGAVQSPLDWFQTRIVMLSAEIRSLVRAALRSANAVGRNRLFRAAHRKRMERRAVEQARNRFYEWRSRFQSMLRFGGQFRDPPPQ